MVLILILSIFLWLAGYFMTARTMSNTGVLSNELEAIITPPKWLYYLCGAPLSKEYPRGAMRVAAFRAQIGGVVLMIFLALSRAWNTSEFVNIIGFALSALISLIITSYVAKHYRVSD